MTWCVLILRKKMVLRCDEYGIYWEGTFLVFEGYATGYEHLTIKKVEFRKYYSLSEMHSDYKFIQNLKSQTKEEIFGCECQENIHVGSNDAVG